MKKIILHFNITLILLCASQGSFAQAYTPFPDSNAVWNVLGITFFSDSIQNSTFHYALFGDTIINATSYSKLFYNDGIIDSTILLTSPNTKYHGALRQEVPSKKVYYLPKDSVYEILIYDFDLNAGDTFLINSNYWNDILICNSVDTMLINNQYRNIFYFFRPLTTSYIFWIEGIGNTKGLLLFYDYGFTINELLCFLNNDTLIYKYGSTPINNIYVDPLIYNTCYHKGSIITNLNEINDENINIYPNPVADISILKLSNSFNSEKTFILIYNYQGKLIEKININKKDELYINKTKYKSGLYFIIITKDNNIFTSKFIVQ